MNYILSFDPGLSTGIALLSYTDTETPRLEESWQFKGGAGTLTDWANSHPPVLFPENTVRIAEKFTARNTRGFSYTTASLEPLRGEGVLIALGLMPDYWVEEKRWRDPSQQYIVGGKDLPDKRKRQHRFLKETGFYVTGKQYSAPDADDARSAIAHGLGYLMKELKHKPTFDLVREWSQNDLGTSPHLGG